MAKGSARRKDGNGRTAGSQQTGKLAGVNASLAANDLLETAVQELRRSGKFTLRSFGTFTIREAEQLEGVNPRTGEVLRIRGAKTVHFRASPTLKRAIDAIDTGDRLTRGFSHAVARAVEGAHAAGLAAPGRENGTPVERRPDGRTQTIDDNVDWSPESWKTRA